MDARSLTPEERQKLVSSLAQRYLFFAKLREHMKAKGWYSADNVAILTESITASIRSMIALVSHAAELPPELHDGPNYDLTLPDHAPPPPDRGA